MEYTERDLTIFNEGFREGNQHTTPSEQTLNLISKMEEALKNFGKELKKMSESMIENNLNTKNALKKQEEHDKEFKHQGERLNGLERSRYGIYIGITMANVVVPIICGLLFYIYMGDLMTEEKVQQIVRNTINSEYNKDD
jgi:hypothetical protein